jgi:hypothetical protein
VSTPTTATNVGPANVNFALDLLQNRFIHMAPRGIEQPPFQSPSPVAERFFIIRTSPDNRTLVQQSTVCSYNKSSVVKAVTSGTTALRRKQKWSKPCQKFRGLRRRQLPAQISTATERV